MNDLIADIRPASTFRKKLFETLEEIKELHQGIVLTKHNKPQAVVLPYDLFDGLMETLDIMQDPEMMKDIFDAQNSKDYISLEEFIKKQDIVINDTGNTTYDVQSPHKKNSRKKAVSHR